MTKTAYYLFIAWFLLLPYTVISSAYLGIAIDKLLAPLFLVLWFVLFLLGYYRFDHRKIFIIMLVLLLMIVRNISFIDNMSLYTGLMWEDAIRLGYFTIPLLYITDANHVRTATRVISINAVSGCLSAILVALGLLTLPYERFSASRIGVEEIQKSIGLFSSYGDLAQYAAYFLLVGIFMLSTRANTGLGKRLIQLLVISIVVMGLIGTQSRSYLLSVTTAFIVAVLLNYRVRKQIDPTLFYLLVSLAGMITLAIIGNMFSDIVNVLSNLGGSSALGTAQGRIWQYQLAFRIIGEYPILGIDAEYYMKYGYIGHFVHNMWLGQMVRGGIVSVLFILGIILAVLTRAMKLASSRSTHTYAIVSVGYVAALMVSTLFYPADSMLFWALLGMASSVVYTLTPEHDSLNIPMKARLQDANKKARILSVSK